MHVQKRIQSIFPKLQHSWNRKLVTIASAVSKRYGKQCREKYFNHLCPTINDKQLVIDEVTIITQ
jgi:hypothetical protein